MPRPATPQATRRATNVTLPTDLLDQARALGLNVAIHAPAHTAALIRHPSRAPRIQDAASAWRLAAPTTILTIAIGAALWPSYSGEAPVRLVCLTLQLLAALTLPHMVLNAWLESREPRRSSATKGMHMATEHPFGTPQVERSEPNREVA